MRSLTLVVLCSAFAATAADAPRLDARFPKAVADGDTLVFSFELLAHGPLTARTVDYVVSVEGASLFSGTAQGFSLAPGAETALSIAGFGDSRAALERLIGKQQFNYKVRGLLHTLAGDQPFTATGTCDTPDQFSQPKKTVVSHSLLSY